MLTKDEFVRRILDGDAARTKSKSPAEAGPAIAHGFEAFDVADDDETTEPDSRFAQLLLEESGFGSGETLDGAEVVLGEQKTNRFLPDKVTYWAKTSDRPFHILLFDLSIAGSEVMKDSLARGNELEDVVHRVVQDVLEGFERSGEDRTAERKQGAQTETLCVVSIADDRQRDAARRLVCFGTKCVATDALEAFSLREEARDWDRPLAEEHLGQLYERHFKPLASGANWQTAFISGDERKRAKALMDECARATPDEKSVQKSIRGLLDEVARSFGLQRKGGPSGHRLAMHALPDDHSIAMDPIKARQPGFHNPFKGVRIFDADSRLVGYIVYVLDRDSQASRLHSPLSENNHFHNVLVVYPEARGATLELWQGQTPLRGRLIAGSRRSRFDGEGGVVQLISQFFVVSRSGIRTSQQLATELAWRALHLRALALSELQGPAIDNSLQDLFNRFTHFMADVSEEEFADAYAQTITYGLLAARWISSGDSSKKFRREHVVDLLPPASPFLRGIFENMIERRFDKNVTWLVDDITELLARTMVREVFLNEEDPVIHFYEDFLTEYDPELKKSMGVFYTPAPVVDFIVRSIDEVLRLKCGLEGGIASSERDQQGNFKVRLLDPAVGTGTFLKRVIEIVHERMNEAWVNTGISKQERKRRWSYYVDTELIPRIAGYELMVAPYVIAHLKLSLTLVETGYSFSKSSPRIPVFLTNALEPASKVTDTLLKDYMTSEATEASASKTSNFTVVLGNPPYRGHSENSGTWISGLIDEYKYIDGQRLVLGQGKWLQNDYVKFLRLGEFVVAGGSLGVIGMITSHSYLDGKTFAGVRSHLRQGFDELTLVDLHGNSNRGETTPDGLPDENVFPIAEGVAIAIGHRSRSAAEVQGNPAVVRRVDQWGPKLSKFEWLRTRTILTSESEQISGVRGEGFVASSDTATEYASYVSVSDILTPSDRFRIGTGFVTTHDEFAVSFTRSEQEEKIDRLVQSNSEEEARQYYRLCTQDQWDYHRARSHLSESDWSGKVIKVLYRPFDVRWSVYDSHVLVHRRQQVNDSLLRKGNVALLVTAQLSKPGWSHCFVADHPANDCAVSNRSRERNVVLPLFSSSAATLLESDGEWTSNLRPEYADQFRKVSSLAEPYFSRAVLAYIYAVLHSDKYRRRYAGDLERNMPRVPIPRKPELFQRLSGFGQELIDLHLLDAHATGGLTLQEWDATTSEVRVGRGFPKFRAGEGRIAISDSCSIGPVPTEVWSYTIGSYAVAQKWLKDRRGRQLSHDEQVRYQMVLAAIERVLVVSADLDAAISSLGG